MLFLKWVVVLSVAVLFLARVALGTLLLPFQKTPALTD